MSRAGMSRKRRAAALALALAGMVGVGACSRDQDPGIVEDVPTGNGSTEPPQLLEDCPPGGPDATTASAGCVDEDGNVLHP